MGVATCIHNLYTPYGNKHGQKEEESYTKKTISTYNWRVTKELAIFEGAQGLSSNNIENLLKCRIIKFIYSFFTLQL